MDSLAVIKPVEESAVDEEVTVNIAGLERTEFERIAAQTDTTLEEGPARTTLNSEFSLTKDLSTDQGQLTAALLAENIKLAVDIAIKLNRYDY